MTDTSAPPTTTDDETAETPPEETAPDSVAGLPTYVVTAEHRIPAGGSRMWFLGVTIDGTKHSVQSKRLDAAKDAIAFAAGIDAATFEIELRIELPGTQAGDLRSIQETARQIVRLERNVERDQADLAKALLEGGMIVRDVATVLAITPAKVQLLVPKEG